MRPPLRSLLVLAALLAALAPARAQLVVVGHPQGGAERLDRNQVINIFLGRYRQLPSGIGARPIDLPAGDAERAAFYRRLVNKEPAEIASYWARLVFSGGTQPPRVAASVDEVLRLVGENPGALGYLDRRRVDGRVRVVYDFSD